MAKSRKKLDLGIRLKPSDVATTLEGEIRIGDSSKFVYAFVDGSEREMLSADQVQTVSNKSIDADSNTISNLETDNLKAGVLNTDLSGAATDTEIPSALAVKNALALQNEASEIDYDNSTSGLAATDVQAAIDEVEGRLDTTEGVASGADTKIDDHIVDAAGAHAASAISNTPSGNLAATDVQGALNELQTDVDTRVVDGGSFTSGSVITPDRLDVKQDTLANLETYAGTASDGQLVFATDEQKMFQVIANELQPVGGAGGTTIEIDQVAHGFAVGEGIYHNGTNWAKAQANDGATLATFVVTEVPDVDSFIAYQFGRVEVPSHGFTVGEYYFLSTSVAGQPTSTEPTSDFSNPLFYVEDANFLQIMVYRPSVVGNQTALDELSDVSAAAPADGEVLTWVNANNRWEAVPAAGDAADIAYSNATSGLTATDTQAAIDEVEGRVDTAESNITTNASNISSNDDDIRDLQKIKNINYIENPDAEVDTTGWATYADAAGENPVDGTGGAANITFTRNTTTPLRGAADFKLSKDAVNRQGEGVSYDFSIAKADLSKKLYISLNFESTVDFADGDVRISVYDVTNSKLIRCNGEDLAGSKGSHLAWFQSDATSTSYRLIFHVSSTNASAYDIVMDDISVGPREVSYGMAATDIESKGAITISAVTSPPTKGTTSHDEIFTRRVGDKLEGTFTYIQTAADGTIGSGDYLIELPEGLQIDEDKITVISTGDDLRSSVLGAAKIHNTNTEAAIAGVIGVVTPYVSGGTSYLRLCFDLDGTQDLRYWGSDFFNLASTVKVSAEFSVPIKGWTSNSLMSEDIGNREVRVQASGNGGESLTANVTNIVWTSVEDTTASWSGSQFTAPETGDYTVSGVVRTTANVLTVISAYIDGAFNQYFGYVGNSDTLHPFSGQIRLEKGQILSLRLSANATLNNSGNHILKITKKAQPQTILETETVAASYSTDSGKTVGNSTITLIEFEDVEYDTHNAYNTSTGVYTVPVTGKYDIKATMALGSSFDVGEIVLSYIYKNGSQVKYGDRVVAGGTFTGILTSSVKASLDLVKGDEIDIRFFQSSGVSSSISTESKFNYFSIHRIK